MKVNYQGVREAIARRVEFEGNSCKGTRIISDTENTYMVFSYTTLIFKIAYLEQNPDFFNLEFYSKTTSKLQGIIADVIFGKSLKELRKNYQKELYNYQDKQ